MRDGTRLPPTNRFILTTWFARTYQQWFPTDAPRESLGKHDDHGVLRRWSAREFLANATQTGSRPGIYGRRYPRRDLRLRGLCPLSSEHHGEEKAADAYHLRLSPVHCKEESVVVPQNRQYDCAKR